MIVRGTLSDVQANEAGHLSTLQRERLQKMAIFRLTVLPTLVLGAVLVVFGVVRGDVVGWSLAGMGSYTLFSAWLRHRRIQTLKAGSVRKLEGVIEKLRSTPLPAFEYEIAIGGKPYVLISGLGSEPLHEGQSYRAFILDGVARTGVIVALEAV